MLNANYVEPERCELCGVEHEPEYPHMMNANFKVNFFNDYKRMPVIIDTYSHCKGLIFECADRYYKKE